MNAVENAVWNFVDRHFEPADVRRRNGQLMIRECPFCHGGQHHEEFTFAIGLHNGAYNCMRARECDVKGSFNQLLEHFGERPSEEADFVQMLSARTKEKKRYQKPDPDALQPITDEIISFFGTRGISEETLKDWKIASDKDGNIVFPFYRNDVLTYVKYRKPKKHNKEDKSPKEWQMSDTEPILYGMDMVSYNKPLVIVEGEIDALSLYEAGVTNVVSVPCGCNNLEWINLCYDWLENFQQIILFGDSDEPGMNMMSVVMKRLGEERCMLPEEYPELIWNGKDYNRICKDANEILLCYGPENLKKLVDSCEPAPIKGVLDLASIPFVDPCSVPRIMTKIPELDRMIGGFGEGGITVLSGQRGEGKSTISGNLLLNAIEQGYNVCAYSGELSPFKFLEWIMLQATESKYIEYKVEERSGRNVCYVSAEIQRRIKSWLSGHFFLYDNAWVPDKKPEEALLAMFEACAKRYGCKLFLVDNLMSILTSADEENKAQAKFMAQLKAFACRYKVHVLVVAHPRKEKPGSTFTNDSVSGSSVITNLADVVLSIEKPNIRVTKNRDFGITDYIQCGFDPCNRRIFQASIGDRIVYSWDHTNLELPENQANALPGNQVQIGRPKANMPI